MATKKPVKKVVKKAVKKVVKTVKKAAPKKVVKLVKKVAKTAKKIAAPKAKPAKAKVKRTPNAAFMKALTPSDILANIIGSAAVARTEAVKRIWTYIKKHNLQDQVNKRCINADEKLKALFGGKAQITMFELAKYLSKHLS